MSWLPTPKMPGPGGSLVEAINAISEMQKQHQVQKYYGPNIQSEMGYRNALTQGQNIENEYMPEKLRQANAFAGLQNQYYGPKAQAEINYSNALTNKYNTMVPLEAKELELKNTYYPDVTKSNIGLNNSLVKLREEGGSGLGVGGKEELNFQKFVHKDNPHLTPEQVYEASNVVRQGGNQLSDGTKLNPMSAATQSSLDRVTKAGTTAPILTGNIKAKQAEAELAVLNKYAQEALKPYGTTYGGKSPQQILDSFKSDEKSQIQLGRFIAAQALNYETAQNRIKLANGQPGVTATEELMRISGQQIEGNFPKLSQTARQEAARYLDEALAKGLEARQAVPIGASTTQQANKKESNNKKEPDDLSLMSDNALEKLYLEPDTSEATKLVIEAIAKKRRKK